MHSMMKTSAIFTAFLLLAACSSGDAAEKAAGNRSLVGNWHTTLPLQGRPTEVVWQARADGSCAYRVAGSSIPCRWKLQGDVLHETADGSASSARLRWQGDDEMTLTIIDNGRPQEAGTQRSYTRR